MNIKIEVSVKKQSAVTRFYDLLNQHSKQSKIEDIEKLENEIIITTHVNDNFNFDLLRQKDYILFFHIV